MRTQERTRNAWDELAVGYDQFVTPSHSRLAEQALRLVGLRAGMRFLDVAAGTGALSIPAARLGAQVVATDISPAMIARLDERVRVDGLANVQSCVMDAHALDLEDDTFDVSASQYGVMLLPDLPRGLRELARVTCPGGRVLLIAFGPPNKVEFLGFFLSAMKAAIPGFRGLPMDPPPLPFQVADPARLREEMEKAGLGDVRVKTVDEQLPFQSAQHLWFWVTNSHPIGAGLVAGLTDAQVLSVQKVLDDMLRERAAGSRVAMLTNPVNIGIGAK